MRIHFESNGAKAAYETLNGQLIQGFDSKKPLEISFFLSKLERRQLQKGFNKPQQYTKTYPEPIIQPQQVLIPNERKQEEPDYNAIRRIEDEGTKREVLGEIIFKKIELHELSEQNKLTFDHIGKITGMILGIEDINEIFDICKNKEHLTSRIFEALELLNSS